MPSPSRPRLPAAASKPPTGRAAAPAFEYEILEKMATGSFGIVFKVRRITDHQVFVMKRIPLLDLTAPQRRDAAQEIAVMQDLHHPCVVAQRDAFLFNDNDLCLVMDYYDGGDMDTRMVAQRELDTYFDFDQVMLWFVQLVLGAQYLHAHNVVHRDIKIHNVFVRAVDQSVVLGDFGISEHYGAADLASQTWAAVAATISGTPLLSASPSPVRADNPESGGGDSRTPPLTLATAPHPTAHPAESPLYSPAQSPFKQHAQHQPPPSQQPLVQVRHFSTSHNNLYSGAGGGSFPARRPSQHTGFFGAADGGGGVGAMEAAMKGTPLYMAPEVLQGGAASPKSDVWSLGCVLYELLALRHPFESRDLAPLVMRVSRGQREPLPAHFPRPVADLINRMLYLDASRRPSCEEVLMVPCVRAYVDLWRRLRTPLDVPKSRGETALMRQLHAWQSDIVTWNARHPDDPRGSAVHYTELERQLQLPACAPSEEREAVERRATEQARAALLSAQPSGLLGSASSFGMNGASHGGTFFYGASGRRITGAATCDVGVVGLGAGQDAPDAFPLAALMMGGMAPTDSMRPYMLYDGGAEQHYHHQHQQQPQLSPKSPGGLANGRPPRLAARRPSSSPPPSPPAAHGLATAGHRAADAGAVTESPLRPFNGAHLEPSPVRPPPAGGAAAERQRRRAQGQHASHGEGAEGHIGARVAAAEQRQQQRNPETPEGGRPRDGRGGAASTRPPIAPPRRISGVDEDALFFQHHRNVSDMRFATLEEVAEAVVAMRHRVQQRMRHQRVLADIEVLHERHGSALLHSMPHVLHVLEVAAAPVTTTVPCTSGSATGDAADESPLVSPEEVYAHMVRQIDAHRSERERPQPSISAAGSTGEGEPVSSDATRTRRVPAGRPLPPRIRELREASALAEAAEAQRRSQTRAQQVYSGRSGSASSAGVAAHYADPAAPLMVAPPADGGAGPPSPKTARALRRWRPYLERRNRLSAVLTGVFEADTLRAVYSYYRTCALLQRDAAVVRRLVPDRRQWAALPSVEELAVLDRRLEPIFDE